MKKEKLYELLSDIDENAVKAAETERSSRSKPKWIKYGAAAAACLVVCAGAGLIISRSDGSGDIVSPGVKGMLVAEAAYPEMPVYPDETMYTDWNEMEKVYDEWEAAMKERRTAANECRYDITPFFTNSTRAFLTGSGTENAVYSPLSLFMALSMSAEISDGNTRQQILDVLGQDSIEALRSDAEAIWTANYIDDGMAKCVLATSLWTNSSVQYRQDVMDSLAQNYYTSSYSGDPASAEYNKMMQDWMNEQTDGLLSEYVSGIEMDPDMILTLASAVNYCGKWQNKFSEERTESGTFHSPDGDVECDFMYAERLTGFYWGENFSAVSLDLENNGDMRLILPDEGVAPEELIYDDEVIDFMTHDGVYKNSRSVQVNMSVPKFDVSSDTDLTDGLKELGITDAFDSEASDFTPLTESSKGVYISKAKQSARVMIDEEGCKASALTVMIYCGAGIPDDEVDFVLDRPFVFEIVSETGMPLFVGIVNHPAV